MVEIKHLRLLQNQGYKYDMFGQPISVGDWVLCKSYGSADKDQLAQVLKVNAKNIKVVVNKRVWSKGPFTPRPVNHVGPWNYYPQATVTPSEVLITRNPINTLKVTPELKAQIEAAQDALLNNHTEIFI